MFINADITDALIAGLFGLITGIIVTYLAAILKYRKEIEIDFDRELREKREDVYSELMKILAYFARYDLPEQINKITLEDKSIRLREWFFNQGGLFLSDKSRDPYFDLKKQIGKLLDKPSYGESPSLEDTDEFKKIIATASLLRHNLAKDIGARRRPSLEGGLEANIFHYQFSVRKREG